MTVYFMKVQDGCAVKIGHALNVQTRLRDIQISNHQILEIVRTVDGGFDVENFYHKYFSDLHIRGEWFTFREDMLDVMPKIDFPNMLSSPGEVSYPDNAAEAARIVMACAMRDGLSISAYCLLRHVSPVVINNWAKNNRTYYDGATFGKLVSAMPKLEDKQKTGKLRK